MTDSPERRILAFHQDDDGWWVADLECGHGRHMRHDPPWHVRPWVTSEDDRTRMLGRTVPCAKCRIGEQG